MTKITCKWTWTFISQISCIYCHIWTAHLWSWCNRSDAKSVPSSLDSDPGGNEWGNTRPHQANLHSRIHLQQTWFLSISVVINCPFFKSRSYLPLIILHGGQVFLTLPLSKDSSNKAPVFFMFEWFPRCLVFSGSMFKVALLTIEESFEIITVSISSKFVWISTNCFDTQGEWFWRASNVNSWHAKLPLYFSHFTIISACLWQFQ